MFGIILIFTMIPFNLWLLPEMNYNFKILTQKISKTRPDIQIQEHQKNRLFGKILYVGEENNGTFNDITIFDNDSNNNISIFSKSGNFTSLNDGILLNLKNGSLHSYNQKTDEYQKTYFENYQISIPFDEMNFGINNLLRSNRQMSINALLDKINNEENKIKIIDRVMIEDKKQLQQYIVKGGELQSQIDFLLKNNAEESSNYNAAYTDLNKLKNKISNFTIKIKNNTNIIPQQLKKINKAYIEIHKKIAIPFACMIFILLGMPLGIISKNGKFSINIGLSLIFIILYWAFLILGETLADEGKLNPFFAMWAGNFFMAILALYLFNIASKENNTFNLKLINMKSYLTTNKQN